MNPKILSEFMNTHEEVHAATHGIYAGIAEWKGTELPDNPDIVKELHYYHGGIIVGTLIRWSAILLIGSAII